MADKREQHRSLEERWVVTGLLKLETPAHFGNGGLDALTDMPLMLDEASGKPLLTGTSMAGALRSYLRERELGFGVAEGKVSATSILFGGSREDDEGTQSALIVHDALGNPAGMELRDGVAINPETRCAEDEKKFDIQLLAAGSTFDLRFELLVGKCQNSQAMRNALLTALQGLENGEITLGMRKRRGYGQCTAGDWKVWKYNLANTHDLLAWLASEREWATKYQVQCIQGKPLADLFQARLWTENKRNLASMEASFAIDGTLLIRSGAGEADSGPDLVHLQSRHKQKTDPVPIIPGTSWAGVLRQRGLKIARTVSGDSLAFDEKGELLKNKEGGQLLNAEIFVNDMFGPSGIKRGEKDVRASRISVGESEIEHGGALVITRVKIDRFTGGALESALFSEQPVIGKPEAQVTLKVSLRNPLEADIGLLLLLLKDLWTGDLPVGGESGVGRGRLKGKHATLNFEDDEWQFDATGEDGGIRVVQTHGKEKSVEDFVKAFNHAMQQKGGSA
jgi:CRISPR/Cas system CSM-associated protein Csm3 (group 7 of RAMP superfamily)